MHFGARWAFESGGTSDVKAVMRAKCGNRADLAGLRRKIEGEVLIAPADLERYSLAECVYRIPPLGAVLPKSREDVQEVLEFAREAGIPVTARGAGTAVAGQSVGSGIILDFSRHLNRVLELRPGEKRARVEPGAILADLNRAAARHRLRFAPDPASGDFCTLGGMIANNAGGPRSVRYGPTRQGVDSLTVALADGQILETQSVARASPTGTDLHAGIASKLARIVDRRREALDAAAPRVRRSASGYDLLGAVGEETIDLARLLVGSEGTLALTLEARLILTPLPGAIATALAHFRDLEAMGKGVLAALGHAPSAVEALDRSFVDLIRRAGRDEVRSLPADTEAILIVEVEAETRSEAAAKLDRLDRDLAGLADGFLRGLDESSRLRIWEIRKAASPLLLARGGATRSTRFIEDACVPPSKLPLFLREIRSFLKSRRLDAAVFGHAGDAIVHVNPFLDPADARLAERMEEISREYTELVLSLGGALSGEHGDGRLRTPFLALAFGEACGAFREVKELFDPRGVLNPGIKVHDGSARMSDHVDLGPRPPRFAALSAGGPP